ncbi:hypothetical protein MBLNU230_g7239t1 [Neophaeotheca triangularis]
MNDFRLSHSLPGIRPRSGTGGSNKKDSPPAKTTTRSRTDPSETEKEKEKEKEKHNHHHHHHDHSTSLLHRRLHGHTSSSSNSKTKHRHHRHSSSPKEPPNDPPRKHTPNNKDSSHSSSTQSRSYGRQAKDTVTSAIELKPPLSFDKLLGRGKATEEHRRHPESENAEQAAEREEEAERQRQREKKQRQEKAARIAAKHAAELNERREAELRAHLEGLEGRGMQATRDLDETLYTVLEKAAVLRSTVGQLQQLCVESETGREEFEEEGRELSESVKGALKGFGGFEKEEKEVGELVRRLGEARDRTGELNERLEEARKRVEGYESRDREAERKSKWRWAVSWTVLGVVGSVFVAVVLARNHAAARMRFVQVGEVMEAHAAPVVHGIRPVVEGVVEAVGRVGNASGLEVGGLREDEDGKLKDMFDEL